MTENISHIDYVGIDISKHTLEVAFDDISKTQCFENSPKHILALIQKLKSLPSVLVVIEPTGGYEMLLEQACHNAGIDIISVLANRVREFARASGQLAKNDSIDAKMLLCYGQTFKLCSNDISMRKNPEFKALMKRREQLVKMISQERNHLENTFNKSAQKQIAKSIKFLEKQLKEVEQAIANLIDADCELKEKSEHLKSVRGVGDILTMQSLSSLPELGSVSNKEIAALAGLAPYVKESGLYRGQARIYGGRADVRKVLYMGCLSAIRCNPDIKQFYNHLRDKGKPFKVAMVACMRKLLVMMNCVCREKRQWQPNYAK